ECLVMRAMRTLLLLLVFTSLCCFLTIRRTQARSANVPGKSSSASRETVSSAAPTSPESGGIRESISSKHQKRYQEWKDEFLSTDIGRAQWEMYAHHPRLALTITISGNNSKGAGSGKYKWNDAGELVDATITLGSEVDRGFPSSVYYPVMNALEPFQSARLIDGNVLAATKLAHEFGHVMRISSTSEQLYNLQMQLVPAYNKIFLSNGHNVNDPRLVEMAKQMGGNPVEIWEDREYWGEANAMLFLRDRVEKEKFHCRLFAKIKQAVEEYAKDYEQRFAEIAKEQGAVYTCGWR